MAQQRPRDRVLIAPRITSLQWQSRRLMAQLSAHVSPVCALTHRGSTPLHFAACAKKNPLQACQALLDGGGDTEVSRGQGMGW